MSASGPSGPLVYSLWSLALIFIKERVIKEIVKVD